MNTRIPNLNTLSTLIDRLSIENVKLAHFENALEHDLTKESERADFRRKIEVQCQIIDALKKELTTFFEEALTANEYAYVKEERTFK